MNPNSMAIWLPVVEQLGIPSPRTELVSVEGELISKVLDGEAISAEEEKELVAQTAALKAKAEQFGYPFFLRTDLASGKHQWGTPCFVPGAETFMACVSGVIEFNELAGMFGLDYEFLAFRELLDLDASFKAFHGLPIARERRYFAEAGKGVVCHHAYWVEDALRFYQETAPPPENWRSLLADLNDQRKDPPYLVHWASAAADLLGGSWSVDFARTKAGDWYLIDMAHADESWHPGHSGEGIPE